MLQGLVFLSLRTLNLKKVNPTILNNRFRSKYSSSLCLYPKTILYSGRFTYISGKFNLDLIQV